METMIQEKFMNEVRCLLGPDVDDLQTLARAAGKRAKTASFDREAIVTSVLSEWKRTRREPFADELAHLAEKSGLTEDHVKITLADLRRAMYATPQLRGLAEDAFQAGVRNEARASNPAVEAILEKFVALQNTQAQAKRSASPVDLAKRAEELREANPELTNIESVRAAYVESGVPLS
jgi:hypothetical protein